MKLSWERGPAEGTAATWGPVGDSGGRAHAGASQGGSLRNPLSGTDGVAAEPPPAGGGGEEGLSAGGRESVTPRPKLGQAQPAVRSFSAGGGRSRWPWTRTCSHAHMHAHSHAPRAHTHTFAHIHSSHTHIHTRARVPTRVHTCTFAHTFTRTHVHMHAHAHTRTFTHAHTHTLPRHPSHQQGFLICHETESQAGSGSEWRVGGRRGGRGEWRRPPAGAERA